MIFAPRCLASFVAASTLFFAHRMAVGAESPAGFDAAIATLRAEREKVETTGTTLGHITAVNEAFFAAVDARTLGLREWAAVVRLNGFAYSARAQAAARALTERLGESAAARDEAGALAAVLRASLGKPAGVDAAQHAGWRQAVVYHPALTTLVRGEFGDLALFAACDAARSAADIELVLALAEHLDARQGTAAAGAVGTYWNLIKRKVSDRTRRQALRQKLVEYLTATLAVEPSGARRERSRADLARTLARLNGPEAREQLLGAPAPDIQFDWISRGDATSLSALRGKIVVLEFWATWCGACVQAIPKTAELVRHFDGFPVQVLGITSVQGAIFGLQAGGTVDCKGDPQKEMRLMAQFLQERGITWPVAFSRASVFNPDYGIEGIPHIVIIAPDGTVRHSASGFRLVDEIQRIEALLEEFQLPRPVARGNP